MFFVLSKIVWWLIAPLRLLVLAQLTGLLLVWRKWRRLGWSLLLASATAFVVIIFTPVPSLLLHPLEHRVAAPARLPDKLDGIILIGSAQQTELTHAYGMPHMSGNAQTMTAFVGLARRYPQAKRVFSGGSGMLFPNPWPESTVVQMFFQEQGLDPASLMVEEKSRNTHENAAFSKAIVRPRPGERWVLITAAFHMPRALGVFRKEGWDVIPYPVAYRTLPELKWEASPDPVGQFEKLEIALHEWIGLAAYELTGRI